MLIVSKCLAGAPCRYDGKDNLVPEIKALVERGEAVAVCPEVLDTGIPVMTEEEYLARTCGESEAVAWGEFPVKKESEPAEGGEA